jgi:hypothetical protein
MRYTILAGLLALSGCADISDVNLGNVESSCGQKCAANHSACVSRFSLFPIRQERTCGDSLRLCAQTCPAR